MGAAPHMHPESARPVGLSMITQEGSSSLESGTGRWGSETQTTGLEAKKVAATLDL
jgi:hypothetical protein